MRKLVGRYFRGILVCKAAANRSLGNRIRIEYGVPVVIMSAKASANDKETVLKLGASHYLAKPFGVEALFAIFDEYVETPKYSMA